jgi:hypothetical protein
MSFLQYCTSKPTLYAVHCTMCKYSIFSLNILRNNSNYVKLQDDALNLNHPVKIIIMAMFSSAAFMWHVPVYTV